MLLPPDPGCLEVKGLGSPGRGKAKIGGIVHHLQRQLTHADASTNSVRRTVAALGEIHSQVNALVVIEFYGLDDLDGLADGGVPY